MPEININNEIIELTDEQLLGFIKKLANGWVHLTKLYCTYHFSGFSNITGTFEFPDIGQNEFNRKLEEQICDPMVRSSYNSIKNELEKMRSLDFDITIWLAKFVNMDVEGTKFDKPKLLRRMRKIVSGKNGGGGVGPIWVQNPGYKEYIDKSTEILESAQAYQKILDQRINELFPDSLYQ